MRTDSAAALGLLALLAAAPARAEQPLSAIDWLSKSVAEPVAPPAAAPAEPAVTDHAGPEQVTVSVLGAPAPDGVGILPARVTGLPRDLWGLGRTEDIAVRITAEQVDTLPTLRALMITLMLAEAEAPPDAGGRGILLLARIDKLLAMGALDQAQALLAVSGTDTADLFRRAFDVALLTGQEDRTCETMRTSPELAPTFPARIFCLARAGDWNAAALTLRTAQVLGYVTPQEDALLSRFLDPDLYEGEPALPPPDRPTPLLWRILEAIGEPVPTQSLPLAFAHAELREQAGWKAQIEAAERLSRAGALEPATLLSLYTARLPAASGGVWDRVAAVQDFDEALARRDAAAVADTLPRVWAQMAQAELEVPFARLYGEDLLALRLEGKPAEIALRVMLLSPVSRTAAETRSPAGPTEAFLIGIARGDVTGTVPGDNLGRAIAPAFTGAEPSPEAMKLLEDGRLGEALLMAIDQVGRGVRGDLRGVTEGLALLRHAGLEDVARHTALELLLLERRG